MSYFSSSLIFQYSYNSSNYQLEMKVCQFPQASENPLEILALCFNQCVLSQSLNTNFLLCYKLQFQLLILVSQKLI